MKNLFGRLMIVATCFIILTSEVNAQARQDSAASTPQTQVQGGGFFSGGNATVNRLPAVPEINCGVAKVSFPAGVRTIWHSHAGGQIIVVVSGTAWYQEKGKAKQVIKQGETTICPPNVMHWHGATPDGPMAHTVVTPNLSKGGVTMGPPVTDQEYNASN